MSVKRGNYYKNKTRAYFEGKGYQVEITEFMTTRFIGQGKVVYVKKDLFASDMIAISRNEILFINSKHYTTKESRSTQVAKGKKEFLKYDFPTFSKQLLVFWQPRKKEPEIIEVVSEM